MAPRKLNLSNTALLDKASARAASLFGIDEGRAYRELPLERVEVNPDQPRRRFDPDEMTALAASIERYGLLQPIVVQEIATDRYRIIAGERRYRALCQLRQTVVPAIVMTSDDPRILAMVENVQRVDLHSVEVATCLRALIDSRGLTQEDAGLLIGKSQAHVARLMGLLRVPPALLEEMGQYRHVPVSALLEIAETEDPGLQRMLWEQARDGHLTIRALRDIKQNTTPALPSYNRVFKGLRKQVRLLHSLREQEGALTEPQKDELRALRQDIDALLERSQSI